MAQYQLRRRPLAGIKHVAITCEDPDAVAKFYKEGFDRRVI